MSMKITEAHNQRYSIAISRFYNDDKSAMFSFTISDGASFHSIALPTKDAMKLALDLLKEAAAEL